MNLLGKSCIASLFMAACSVNAASPQIDFTVEAVIPDNDFYVSAVNGWDTRTQQMAWDSGTSSLTPVTQQLQIKNTSGGVKAWLLSQPMLTASTSTDEIPLDISIAGKTLPATASNAVTLYDASQASTEKTASVKISQQSPFSTRPAAGDYMGTVTMIFDTVPAP